MSNDEATSRWLLLIYQFPQGPGSRRVRIWRRLQGIGAIAIKNSVYALPQNEQAREDFEWLLAELRECGAEAVLLESRFIGGMSDRDVRESFNSARDADYRQLVEELDDCMPTSTASEQAEAALENARRASSRARKRFAEIEAIDFFGAAGRDRALAALRSLDECLSASGDAAGQEGESMAESALQSLKKRVWVTRRNVRVDRMASAWLIRRWIDADAEFKFVSGKDYAPAAGELRFDMFEAEFTHEGDQCTFEVLSRRFAPDDEALRCIAEVVHDIDLKDARFNRPETAGIAGVLDGIVARVADDEARIERGAVLFEDLYRHYRDGAG